MQAHCTKARVRIVVRAQPLHVVVYETHDVDGFAQRVRDAARRLPSGPISCDVFIEREALPLSTRDKNESFTVVCWWPLAASAEDLARLAWHGAVDFQRSSHE